MLLLIPLLPLAGFVVNATLGRRLSKGVSGAVAVGAMALSFGVAVAAVLRLLRPAAGRTASARSTQVVYRGSPPAA